MGKQNSPLRPSTSPTTEHRDIPQKPAVKGYINPISIFWAAAATIFLIFTYFPKESQPVTEADISEANLSGDHGKRNVIFMVSDGMGPASVALARNFFQHTQNKDFSPLTLDEYFVGNSRTQSSDSFVTDSAAGATAFSCCLKSYNGAIGVNPEGLPCATIMEAAKLAGYKTGLVVTTRITDATPASFAAHAHYRWEEDFIAEQLVNWNNAHPFGSMVDLMLGGGRCHFLPASVEGSCRSDERDLIADSKAAGWTYIDSMSEFKELDLGKNVNLPLMGLFAPGDLPFSIDYHDDSLPRLNETAITAVQALEEATKNSDEGFFLLVEGSRIDHAGHSNDPGAQVREVLAYDETFQAMAHYAEHSEVPTIVVSTSDHETGGLSVSRQLTRDYPEYLWFPEVLARAKHSTEFLSRKLRAFDRSKSSEELHEFIRLEILGENGLGLDDIEEEEVAFLAHHRGSSHDHLSLIQSLRAQVGWSTHGHSAVDVNVYAAATHPEVLEPLRGGNENTEVGEFMKDFLRVSDSQLSSLTTDLRNKFGDRFETNLET